MHFSVIDEGTTLKSDDLIVTLKLPTEFEIFVKFISETLCGQGLQGNAFPADAFPSRASVVVL